MDFRITFTRTGEKCRAAFTLVEMMVVSALALVVLAAVLSFLVFSNRSFASLTNYLDLDQKTQLALDKMSREIRQVNKLTAYASTNLTFEDYDGDSVTYASDPNQKLLIRTKGSTT